MIRILKAPERPESYAPSSVFLAGGITDVGDWQAELSNYLLARVPQSSIPRLDVFNPRRDHFDVNDPSQERIQITWEFDHLMRSTKVIFVFGGGESVQPITLYEYGRYLTLGKVLGVYLDPDYKRRDDVLIQTELTNPHIPIHASMNSLGSAILEEFGLHRSSPVFDLGRRVLRSIDKDVLDHNI